MTIMPALIEESRLTSANAVNTGVVQIGSMLGPALGFDNVISVTLIQRWAPPALLGRVWGLLMLASVGSFPVSTFIAGLTAELDRISVPVVTLAADALPLPAD